MICRKITISHLYNFFSFRKYIKCFYLQNFYTSITIIHIIKLYFYYFLLILLLFFIFESHFFTYFKHSFCYAYFWCRWWDSLSAASQKYPLDIFPSFHASFNLPETSVRSFSSPTFSHILSIAFAMLIFGALAVLICEKIAHFFCIYSHI